MAVASPAALLSQRPLVRGLVMVFQFQRSRRNRLAQRICPRWAMFLGSGAGTSCAPRDGVQSRCFTMSAVVQIRMIVRKSYPATESFLLAGIDLILSALSVPRLLGLLGGGRSGGGMWKGGVCALRSRTIAVPWLLPPCVAFRMSLAPWLCDLPIRLSTALFESMRLDASGGLLRSGEECCGIRALAGPECLRKSARSEVSFRENRGSLAIDPAVFGRAGEDAPSAAPAVLGRGGLFMS